MFALERRKKIHEIIEQEGRITVEELSNRLNVSVVTIRRDLDYLEKENMISRTFGGAVHKERVAGEKTYTEKATIQHQEKQAIAEAAAKYVKDDMVIILDAGTTIGEMCQFLHEKQNLTVITFDLQIALTLSDYDNIQLIFIGGEISPNSKSATGVEALYQLDKYTADIAFIGCDAFNIDKGVSTTSSNRLYLKEKIMTISEKNILLGNSEKYQKKVLARFAYLDEFDQLIFDNENPELCSHLLQTELPYELV